MNVGWMNRQMDVLMDGGWMDVSVRVFLWNEPAVHTHVESHQFDHLVAPVSCLTEEVLLFSCLPVILGYLVTVS